MMRRPPPLFAAAEDNARVVDGMADRLCWRLMVLASASAQAPGLGSSAELVDPQTFRVCADPHDLPFSDEAGGGFENKLASLLASKLGRPPSYTYYPQVIGFVRNTLNALRCDVVMGVAVGDDLMQTTNPYYHTTYALVFKPGNGLDGIESLEDPRLKGKHIGVIAGTPPSSVLVQQGLMALAKPYPLTVDTRVEVPSQTMANDIASGQIDAGVLWGPIAGYYAQHVDTAPGGRAAAEGTRTDGFPHRDGRAAQRPGLEAQAQSAHRREPAGDQIAFCSNTACRCWTSRANSSHHDATAIGR